MNHKSSHTYTHGPETLHTNEQETDARETRQTRRYTQETETQ